MRKILLVIALLLLMFVQSLCGIDFYAYSQASQAASDSEKLVGPVVFHWFCKNGGQWYSPWIPLEGRGAWDGSIYFWQRQERFIRQAGFNMEFFQVAYSWEDEQKNHLFAIKGLCDSEIPTPKIVPFFAAESFRYYRGVKDLTTEKGRDYFYQTIKNWFNLYGEIFHIRGEGDIDTSQFVFIEAKVLIGLWYVPLRENYAPPDFFRYLNQRLLVDFGFEAFWSTHPNWNGANPDEINYLFCGMAPVQFSGKETADLLIGFWPPTQNQEDFFLARNKGQTIAEAWESILKQEGVNRIYVESWNEYTEGSGMYPARPTDHFIGDGHWSEEPVISKCWNAPCHPVQKTDSWGASPWQYIDISRLYTEKFLGKSSGKSDAVPPHVLIAEPRNLQTVSNSVLVKLFLADNIGIQELDLWVDDYLFHLAYDGSAEFSFKLKTIFLENGEHILRLTARDNAGNEDEDFVNIVVLNNK